MNAIDNSKTQEDDINLGPRLNTPAGAKDSSLVVKPGYR